MMTKLNTTVTMSVERYTPSIDLSKVSIWEAMKLVDLIAAVSTMLNAAIGSGDCDSIDKFLDDWQALLNNAVFDIADVVNAMRPTSEREQRARNWLLAKVDLPCAEGLVTIAGPGAPTFRDDAFTAGLIAAGYTEQEKGK